MSEQRLTPEEHLEETIRIDREHAREMAENRRKRDLCRMIGNRLPKNDRYGQWLRGEG